MAADTNPLSYNSYIAQMGVLAVYTVVNVAGVNQFKDAPPQISVPNMLNYAELRIQRDLDLLSAQSANNYTLTAGNNVFPIPVDDFVAVHTIEITNQDGTTLPLLPVSKEFIQNVYGGASTQGPPQYFAMYGDTFGGNSDTNTNIIMGPPPDLAYPLKVFGIARVPSIYQYASAGPADTSYTYISAYYPDLLIMASMIFITMLQRNFGPTGDSPEMGMTYEKQYQALRLGAIANENQRKQMGSGWSGYSTPVSATPTR